MGYNFAQKRRPTKSFSTSIAQLERNHDVLWQAKIIGTLSDYQHKQPVSQDVFDVVKFIYLFMKFIYELE